MALEEILRGAEERMAKAIEALKKDVSSVRTGRAAPSLVESITADAYGMPTPLIQLASISVPEPRQIVIQPYDKSLVKAIEKAILASDLALTPNSDGALIRLNIPSLTEERRKDLVKLVHKKVEEGRIEIRTLRRHGQDEIRSKEKGGGISADELKRVEAQLQKITDRFILACDEIGAAKEKEISAV